MPIPEGMPKTVVTTKRVISRRRAIRLGVEAAAGVSVGVTTTAWVKPKVASVNLKEGCSGSPPPGRPSIEVWKDAHQVKRFGKDLIVSGTIKIRNAAEVQVIVEKLHDTVQYRDGNNWKDAPTSFQSLSGCGLGSCIKVGKSCRQGHVPQQDLLLHRGRRAGHHPDPRPGAHADRGPDGAPVRSPLALITRTGCGARGSCAAPVKHVLSRQVVDTPAPAWGADEEPPPSTVRVVAGPISLDWMGSMNPEASPYPPRMYMGEEAAAPSHDPA